jgi:hypothetical protein
MPQRFAAADRNHVSGSAINRQRHGLANNVLNLLPLSAA